MNSNLSIFVMVLLLLAWFHSGAWAQEPLTHAMTLHDCMEYAISHSTKMRIEAANRNDEQWQRRQSIMQVFTPNVDAQTYAYDQYGRNLDPETNTYNSVTTFHNGYSVSAGITLFDGFRSINNMRLASTMVKLGRSKEQQAEDQICLATMEAYYNVVYYTELEKVLTEQVGTAKSARDKAVRQEELGQKGHADVLQMESELAQKEYQLINATNKRRDAMITLKDVMFWPTEQELVAPSDSPYPKGICFAAQGGEIYIELVSTPTSWRSITDLPFIYRQDELTETAKSMLPSAEIASLNVKQAELDLKMAQGSYSPKLSLYGGWSTTYYTYPRRADYKAQSFGDQFKNNAGEYVELTLSFPIFDQFLRRTNLHHKKNALTRAKAEYDQTMRDIENEVARAINDRDGAFAAFQQADKLATFQQEAYRLSTKQFENGLISAIEYQTASQTYLNAMAERVNALLLLKLKDAVVRYFQGESYLSITNNN